jgi:hypothetical protein
MKNIPFLILALLLFITSPAQAFDGRFSPFVETFPNGRIDWDNGYFYGTGTGYPHENMGSKARALKVAQAGALSSILQVAAGMRVDDKQTLAHLESTNRIIQIKGLVRYEPYQRVFIKTGPHPFFKVIYRAPMTGVEGLTRRLLHRLRLPESSWKDFPKPGTPEQQKDSLTWLVLDAREFQGENAVNPAIFPKIMSAKGETIYELKGVDQEALTERGMARYVVSDAKKEDLRSSPGRPVWALFRELLLPNVAQAEERQKRKRRGRYIIKDVKEVQGLMKTNVVISELDAESIKAEDENSQILKKCRVIVIVSSSLGGIEGKNMKYLALFH